MTTMDQKNTFPPITSEWLSKTWRDRAAGVLSHQKQIINWLFAVNTGGVAGMLTLISAGKGNVCITLAVSFFAVGLIAICLYAAWMFYFALRHFLRFQEIVNDYYADPTKVAEFWEKLKKLPVFSTPAELIAIFSGVAAIAGVVFGLIHVYLKP
ncbi:MAG: hypothetical protein PHV34_22280 [Verrucomicrobiae bacterium]|nr:hypothetical protein [Verrucomicrobiae bacterium]